MTSINLNLTGEQIHDICDALNARATAHFATARTLTCQAREIQITQGNRLRRIAGQLIGFLETARAGTRNPHVPFVIES